MESGEEKEIIPYGFEQNTPGCARIRPLLRHSTLHRDGNPAPAVTGIDHPSASHVDILCISLSGMK
ncbi:hypothetical protein U9R87_001041 [Serratia marcescens]|nr:hypothetical protein [Serratia marcescens]